MPHPVSCADDFAFKSAQLLLMSSLTDGDTDSAMFAIQCPAPFCADDFARKSAQLLLRSSLIDGGDTDSAEGIGTLFDLKSQSD